MRERDHRNGSKESADNAGKPKLDAKITDDSAYILITPAKNEAKLIRGVLESVTNQTIRAAQWIIVDDGSTDETAAIVEEYARRYSFISLVRIQRDQKRNFSSKAIAFKAGVDAISVRDYSFIGNLDADITFDPNYYEAVLQAFRRDPKLGIAGGRASTVIAGNFVCYDNTVDSVAGAVQLFRRECYEETGGYRPMPYGGIDAAVEIIARFKGWKVHKTDVPAFEHRTTGTAQSSRFGLRYRDGWKFHSLGYSTAFFTGRCLSRLKDQPIVIGSLLAMMGFFAAKVTASEICLPKETVAYLHNEQLGKLRLRLRRLFQIAPASQSGHSH